VKVNLSGIGKFLGGAAASAAIILGFLQYNARQHSDLKATLKVSRYVIAPLPGDSTSQDAFSLAEGGNFIEVSITNSGNETAQNVTLVLPNVKAWCLQDPHAVARCQHSAGPLNIGRIIPGGVARAATWTSFMFGSDLMEVKLAHEHGTGDVEVQGVEVPKKPTSGITKALVFTFFIVGAGLLMALADWFERNRRRIRKLRADNEDLNRKNATLEENRANWQNLFEWARTIDPRADHLKQNDFIPTPGWDWRSDLARQAKLKESGPREENNSP